MKIDFEHTSGNTSHAGDQDMPSMEFFRSNAIYDMFRLRPETSSYESAKDLADKILAADYVRTGYVDSSKVGVDKKLMNRPGEACETDVLLAALRGRLVEEAEGGLQILRAPTGQPLDVLPAFGYAKDSLFPDFLSRLREKFEHHPGGVIEIGGLSRIERPTSPLISYELIRECMQQAVRHEANETWLITFAEKAYKPIVSAFGPRVIERAGEDIIIDAPDEHVTLIPCLVEPAQMLENIARSIAETDVDPLRKRREFTLAMMANGLSYDRGEIPSEVQTMLSVIQEDKNGS